jgi:hypothetical protein
MTSVDTISEACVGAVLMSLMAGLLKKENEIRRASFELTFQTFIGRNTDVDARK